ncbi:DUF6345 domain-containing protein [Paracoccus laeviglucosivorans]|uniref:Uncharacterized protein n=1 Tax=Paracoccus laeviglucosivorans TaxID=1197861 RepID=A0A521C3U9_9RHOB|nr:DUF6345 domain-containing protein [Paracoccus laeviglucosivorans]SMO53390.1 hypothetical protein SAMN06265221_103351 [Paracoccus laeviglucosivorans]
MQDQGRQAELARKATSPAMPATPFIDPALADPARTGAGPAASPQPGEAGIYGACSAEIFRAAGSLNAAHRDAGGFLDQIDQFAMPDFWRRDASVRAWIYARKAQDGAISGDMDGVRVFYHAGHGAMDEAGNFYLPMGAMWQGADASLGSARMRFGADRLRYLYWSASESLRVTDNHCPLRSWGPANRGLRMMFGFDSTCWDSGRYGQNFWRNWRMGKSFSQSWLDGAVEVSPDHVPVVSAMGASRDEVQARLYGEARFEPQRAARDWWLWRWVQPLAQHRRDPLTEPPAAFQRARLLAPETDRQLADAVLHAMGLDLRSVVPRQGGAIEVNLPGIRFLRSPQGSVLLEFARSGRGARGKISLQRRSLVGRAWSALRRHGFLRAGHELCFDALSLSLSAGRTLRSGEEPMPEVVDEISVQFRQVIEGVPVIASDAGWVRAVLCPDGTLLRIEANLRQVATLLPAQPVIEGDAGVGCAMRHALAQQAARLMRDLAARGAAPLTLSVLPGTTEVGYGIRSNTARLIVRQGVEIRCVRGFRKRYWVQSDLCD